MRLVPSVERVRFTSSGTEATLMALRLARDFTGKPRILRFRTHFHGWPDHMTHGVASQFDGPAAPGVLTGVPENVPPAEHDDVPGTREPKSGGQAKRMPDRLNFGGPSTI